MDHLLLNLSNTHKNFMKIGQAVSEKFNNVLIKFNSVTHILLKYCDRIILYIRIYNIYYISSSSSSSWFSAFKTIQQICLQLSLCLTILILGISVVFFLVGPFLSLFLAAILPYVKRVLPRLVVSW